MKYTHHIVVTVILLLFTFTTVVYTACNKDKCKDVQCLNGVAALMETAIVLTDIVVRIVKQKTPAKTSFA